MDAERLELPWPPSVNRYWRSVNGMVLISEEGRRYRKNVAALVRVATCLHGRVGVVVHAYPPDRRRRDIDNLLKAILDSLQRAGAFDDDSQVDELFVKRMGIVPGGIIHLWIREFTKGEAC